MDKIILGQALLRLGIDPKGMQGQISTLSNSFTNINQDLFRTSMVLGGVTAGLGAFLNSIGQVGYEFDKNMAIVKATTGSTAEEMQRMEKVARDMGESTIYGAKKASEGLITLARIGLNASDSMKVLGPAMKLAQGQQTDMTITTETLIKQLKAFNAGIDETNRYANVMAATSSKTAADMEGLATALSYAGPIAHTAGIDFEELNTALGFVFNAGIKASRAGTSLRFAMSTLVAPTRKSRDALKQLGLTADDVNPKNKKLGEIFELLAERLAGTEDKAKMLFNIFGQRASTAVAAITNAIQKNGDAWMDLKYQIQDTDEVQRQYDVQLNTWSGNIMLIGSSLQELSLQFTTALMPVMRMVTEGIAALVNWFKSLSPEFKAAIGITAVMATAFTGLALILSTVGYAFATIGSLLGKVSLAFAGIRGIVVGNIEANQANVASYDALGAAITGNVIPTLLKEELVRAGLNKRVANGIAMYAMESTALEKNNVSRLRAVSVIAAESATKKGAVLSATALSASLATGAIGAQRYSGALTHVAGSAGIAGKAFKGLFRVMGGWTGLAIIGIMAATTAIVGMVAKTREAKRAAEENTKALGEQATIISNLQAKYDTLIASGKTDAETQRELRAISRALNAEKVKLLEMAPLLIKAYNAETGAITLESDAVKNLIDDYNALKMAKNVPTKKGGQAWDPYKAKYTERKLAISGMDEKQLAAERIKMIREVQYYQYQLNDISTDYGKIIGLNNTQMEVLVGILGQAYEKMGKNESAAKEWNAAFGFAKASGATGVGGNVAEFMQKMRSILPQLANTNREFDYAQNLMVLIDQRLKEIGVKVPQVADDFDDLGDGAAGAAQKAMIHFDALANALRNLEDSIEDSRSFSIEKSMDFDTPAVVDKVIKKIEEYFNKANDLSSKLRDVQAQIQKDWRTIEENAAKGDKARPVDEAQFRTEFINYMREAREVDKQIIALKESETIALKNIWSEYTRDVMKMNDELYADNKQLSAAIKSDYIHNLDSQLDALKATKDAEIKEIDRTLDEHQRVLANGKYMSLEAINAEWVLISELCDKKLMLEEQYQREKTKIMIDYEKAQLQNTFDITSIYKTSLERLKMEKELAKQMLQVHIDNNDMMTQDYFDSLVRMKEATKAYADEIRAYNNEMMGAFFGAAGEMSGMMADSGGFDMSAFIEIAEALYKFADEVSYAASSAAAAGDDSYDLGESMSGATSIIGLFTTVLTVLSDEIDAADQELMDEYQARHDAIQITREHNSELLKLIESTGTLRSAFIDFARSILGLQSTNEEMDLAVSEANESVRTTTAGWFNFTPATFMEKVGVMLRGDNMNQGMVTDPEVIKLLRKLESEYSSDWTAVDLFQFIQDNLPKDIADAIGRGDADAATQFSDFLRDYFGIVPGERTGASNVGGTSGLDSSAMFATLTTADFLELFSGLTDLYGAKLVSGLHDALYSNISGDPDEILNELTAIKDGFDDILTNGSDQLKALLKWEDYAKVIELIFKEKMALATTPEEVQAAVVERLAGYDKIRKDPQLWSQVPQVEKFNIADMFRPENIGQAIRDGIKEMESQFDPIVSAAEAVVEAFNNGEITFQDATDKLAALSNSIANMPAWLQTVFDGFASQLTGQTGEPVTEEDAAAQIDKIRDEAEDYKSDIADLDEEMNDIITGWRDLIKERYDIINGFSEDADKIRKDSRKRVDELNAERNAILGTFDFSETQNQRSQRFAKAREVENKILDEVLKTQEALRELEEDYLEALAAVDVKLAEYEDKWGSIAAVYDAFADKRAARELEFIEFLKIEGALLDRMFILTQDLAKWFAEGGVDKILDSMDTLDALNPSALANTGGGAASVNSLDNIVAEAIDSRNNPTYEQAPILNPVASSSLVPSALLPKPTKHGNIFDDHAPDAISKNINDISLGKGLQTSLLKNIPSGSLVGSPTMGLEGLSKSMATSGQQITIHEHIDLRGAYGISSPAIAEKVYREVWAPARRKVVNNYVNSRGKVIR